MSPSSDTTIKIWGVSSEKCLLTLTSHTDRVEALAYSPDRGYLASGGADGSISIWDVESSPAPVAQLSGRTADAHTFSHCGRCETPAPSASYWRPRSPGSRIRVTFAPSASPRPLLAAHHRPPIHILRALRRRARPLTDGWHAGSPQAVRRAQRAGAAGSGSAARRLRARASATAIRCVACALPAPSPLALLRLRRAAGLLPYIPPSSSPSFPPFSLPFPPCPPHLALPPSLRSSLPVRRKERGRDRGRSRGRQTEAETKGWEGCR
jgi:hypothetical protein